jgi:chemosensory pili system protein ChpA (sensor histidine kinase/response regulator)
VVLVRSANETYAIPLAAVSQVLRIEPEQLERVGRKPVLRLGGKVVPTMYLAEFTGQQVPPDANLTRLKAVVLNIGDQRLALMVDMVLEAREVVVKTLGNMLGRVRGVTGATLMGDGSVVLILNPNDMLQQQAASPQVRLRPTPVSRAAADNYQVLIVDDSPSVRRVLTTLVRNTGWTPYAAKDGLEALEMIHASVARPDVVLLDIEMPRMDGYELTASLRAMAQHRHTPVVMLTSRAGEKHRKRAFEVGATEYMVKPYPDEELLSVVRRVVHQARGAVKQ